MKSFYKPSVSLYLFWLTVFLVAATQFYLCYTWMIYRTYFGIPDYEFYKKWGAPFLVFLPAVWGTRGRRFWGLLFLSFLFSFYLQIESVNRFSRPSLGHVAGISGLLQYNIVPILAGSLFFTPITFALLYLPEKVLGDYWRSLFLLPCPRQSFPEIWAEAIGIHRPANQQPELSAHNSDPL